VQLACIIIIIINEEIIVASNPKTTRTRYKINKTAKYYEYKHVNNVDDRLDGIPNLL